MNRCKTCKWWDRSDENETYVPAYIDVGLGQCARVVRLWEALEWNKRFSEQKISAVYKNTLFFTQDGSCYRAELYTLPDFGCVHHEAKE